MLKKERRGVLWCLSFIFGLQEGSSQNLARYVEEEARDLGGESFTRFMDSLYEKIHALVESSDVNDNLAAVRAIDELIDVQLGEIATKIAKFASFLRNIFEHKKDSEVLINASRALGHLAATGGALTADVVEYQVIFFPRRAPLLPLRGPKCAFTGLSLGCSCICLYCVLETFFGSPAYRSAPG